MNRKSLEDRCKIIQLLVEGSSLRSTSRIMDCSINTVTKMLVETGAACEDYQRKHFINLPCQRIQVDEIWSFVKMKRKNAPKNAADIGDIWTWTSICPDTKLVPCWVVGKRSMETAKAFMDDLAPRMKNRIQLTSDGFGDYVEAVEQAFGSDVDFAMLVKLYNSSGVKAYRGAVKNIRSGNPDPGNISTSMVERQNLTMRTSIKRFARETNAFSKKIENHRHAIALHFMYYNFCRIHQTLKVTPAMAAGITGRMWGIEDIARLAER